MSFCIGIPMVYLIVYIIGALIVASVIVLDRYNIGLKLQFIWLDAILILLWPVVIVFGIVYRIFGVFAKDHPQ